jgi:hypothetical protein
MSNVIDSYFTSKVRIKILKHFFLNPKGAFHIREMVRITKEEVNAVRRELMRMELSGLLFSQKNGNRLNYHLNPDFLLYSEFRSIIHKEFGLGHEIIKHKKQLGKVITAVLSNTFINLEPSTASDLDLLIVGDPDTTVLEAIIENAQDQLDREIFFTVMSEKEFENAKRRRDPFVYSLMVLPKVTLIGSDMDFAK